MASEIQKPTLADLLASLHDVTEELGMEFLSNFSKEEYTQVADSMVRIQTAVSLLSSAGREAPYAATEALRNYYEAIADPPS